MVTNSCLAQAACFKTSRLVNGELAITEPCEGYEFGEGKAGPLALST
jgi:hypothetical protein